MEVNQVASYISVADGKDICPFSTEFIAASAGKVFREGEKNHRECYVKSEFHYKKSLSTLPQTTIHTDMTFSKTFSWDCGVGRRQVGEQQRKKQSSRCPALLLPMENRPVWYTRGWVQLALKSSRREHWKSFQNILIAAVLLISIATGIKSSVSHFCYFPLTSQNISSCPQNNNEVLFVPFPEKDFKNQR